MRKIMNEKGFWQLYELLQLLESFTIFYSEGKKDYISFL